RLDDEGKAVVACKDVTLARILLGFQLQDLHDGKEITTIAAAVEKQTDPKKPNTWTFTGVFVKSEGTPPVPVEHRYVHPRLANYLPSLNAWLTTSSGWKRPVVVTETSSQWGGILLFGAEGHKEHREGLSLDVRLMVLDGDVAESKQIVADPTTGVAFTDPA